VQGPCHMAKTVSGWLQRHHAGRASPSIGKKQPVKHSRDVYLLQPARCRVKKLHKLN
jgi:hypothetical protein